jgi:hypothetical protein
LRGRIGIAGGRASGGLNGNGEITLNRKVGWTPNQMIGSSGRRANGGYMHTILSGGLSQIPSFPLFKADIYRRFGPIGDSLFMRAAGAVFPKYAQTPQILTHPVNDRKFDHQSQ